MASDFSSPPSFSPGRRWSAGFNVALGLLAALAIVVALNFISRSYFFHRAFVSAKTRVQLAPQTLGLLKAITNDVRVTLYYDKDDAMYPTISALLNEYHLANRRIRITTVDYNRNPVEAQKTKAAYKLNSAEDKDLVIFDCAGRVKMVPGAALTEFTMEAVPNEREREFRKKPVAFKGELMFSSMLLAVNNPQPLRAHYLLGHGEYRADSAEDQSGYQKFLTLVMQNFIQVEPLRLLGTNTVPADSSLLIIAGPTAAIPEAELAKISRYLDEGGRLLVLFDYRTAGKTTGLEALLEKWDVQVGPVVQDEQHSSSTGGPDIVVENFARHPVVSALPGSSLQLYLPRAVARLAVTNSAADAPKVEELAFTSPGARLLGETNAAPRAYSLAVAVEKGAVKGVANERGTTRIVVAGDAVFLTNLLIDYAANRDFASLAINWLTDRAELMQGLGPRPVTEFKLVMTQEQFRHARWLLLGGLPGAVLLVGALVWFSRRN